MKFSNITLAFLLIILTYCAFRCIVNKHAQHPDPNQNPTNNSPAFVKKGIHKKKYTDGQVYYLYIPKEIAQNPTLATEIVAIIHGYSGQANGDKGKNIALKNLKRFRDYADQNNALLIAPHFNEKLFDSDYQRFNLDAKRSDIRLINLIKHTKKTFPNLEETQINLFGFSGGGQFVHRFCAFHPNMVKKAIISGSGWYMWPTHSIPYPLGFNLDKFPNVLTIDTKLFVQCDMLVLIGEDDKRQGSFRIEYKGYNLNDMQGRDRVTRARNWVNAIRSYAISQGVTSNIQLVTVPDVEHRTTNKLMEVAFDFLADKVVVY